MTSSEFRAWFAGFTEGMDGLPTDEQWNYIKFRVTLIASDAPQFYELDLLPRDGSSMSVGHVFVEGPAELAMRARGKEEFAAS